jgi:hypothetical protein
LGLKRTPSRGFHLGKSAALSSHPETEGLLEVLVSVEAVATGLRRNELLTAFFGDGINERL